MLSHMVALGCKISSSYAIWVRQFEALPFVQSYNEIRTSDVSTRRKIWWNGLVGKPNSFRDIILESSSNSYIDRDL